MIKKGEKMVIAKSEWFKSKKGDIWRLDIPWQGYVYVLIALSLPIVAALILPNGIIETLICITLSLFITIDFVTAYEKSFDERETIQYANAYKNAFWGIMLSFFVSVPLLVMYDPDPSIVILFIVTILVSVSIFIGTLVVQYKKES